MRDQSNTTRTARILFTHPYTILPRLARVDRLLPTPLDSRGLQVALALAILHGRGAI